MDISQALAAFAGLGFFLAGLNMLSSLVRTLASRQVRTLLARLTKLPFSGPFAGTLLGALTQSASASAFVCIGLLNARALSLPGALSITSWSGVGTSVLVFLASIDLHLAALFAISLVGLFYLASLHQSDTGRRTAELFLSIGLTLLGLSMVKDAGHILENNAWVQEFFIFSAESWAYGFLIGMVITLIVQSSSTVSILVVAMSATGLLPLQDSIVLVCGANLGSGLSVALISSHLTGPPRQLAIWQTVVKALGSLAVLIPALVLFRTELAFELTQSLRLPVIIAITFLLLNVAGAVLAGLIQAPMMRLLEQLVPADPNRQQFEPAFLIDEAVEDPETARLLAACEQSRLIGVLPHALAVLRPEEVDGTMADLPNAQRWSLSRKLAADIQNFISEAVERNPQNADVSGLLLLQRGNDHLLSLIDALHTYVEELSGLKEPRANERDISRSMTESLHLLLDLLSEQANGNDPDTMILKRLTHDRSDVMTKFRNQITSGDTPSNTNRESLFVASGLFERAVWLIGRLSVDLEAVTDGVQPAGAVPE